MTKTPDREMLGSLREPADLRATLTRVLLDQQVSVTDYLDLFYTAVVCPRWIEEAMPGLTRNATKLEFS
jgi:hypothetical protein